MDTEVKSETLDESMEKLLQNAEGHYLIKVIWTKKDNKAIDLPKMHLTYILFIISLGVLTVFTKSSWFGLIFMILVLVYLIFIVSVSLFFTMRFPIDIFNATSIPFIQERVNSYYSYLDNAVSVEIERHSLEQLNSWVITRKPLYKGVSEAFKILFAPFALLSLYTIYKIITDTLGIEFTNLQFWQENFLDHGLDLIAFTLLFFSFILITVFVQLSIFRLTLRSSILDFIEALLKTKK